jgi:hypothetical protein
MLGHVMVVVYRLPWRWESWPSTAVREKMGWIPAHCGQREVESFRVIMDQLPVDKDLELKLECQVSRR